MTGRVFRAPGPLPAASGLIRLGTRRSRLALAQSTQVAERIAQATGVDVALITVTTEGDISRAPLSQLGGTGVFVSALREALLDGVCDLAVHSFKDLPTAACPGISVGAVPERADPRDAWCAKGHVSFADAPSGFRVGTGSPRRVAQLLARRPDLQVTDIRGNVDTRLARLDDDLDAVVLAAAGLDRIGRAEAITERLPLEGAPPAPGQGALALEVRTEDLHRAPIAEALRAMEHVETRVAATAERELLAALEAGCAAPIGAIAHLRGDSVHLGATVYRVDGTEQLDALKIAPLDAAVPPEQTARALGRAAAQDLLDRGAAALADLGAGKQHR